jgi:succinylglutamate desuccinylase
MRKSKLLVLVGTHGDEAELGRKALDALSRRGNFIPEYDPRYPYNSFGWILANPRAVKAGVRYTDTDLNRSAPGDPKSLTYEERRAAEILAIAEPFEMMIDIHGTPTESGVFALITDPKPANIGLASSLAVENVVIWSSRKQKPRGPLTAFHPCSIELECGPKASRTTTGQLRKVLERLMNYDLRGQRPPYESKPAQRWFVVDGKVMQADADLATVASWHEFEPVTHDGDTFCPLLLNREDAPIATAPTYAGVRCHKAREINFRDIFSR